ncbi:hypothetical protein F4810DRAFT_696518 [Camillea tinctor]|nr:hypothetical protein F4810DRAFT_696518 [Camillea tinctor]
MCQKDYMVYGVCCHDVFPSVSPKIVKCRNVRPNYQTCSDVTYFLKRLIVRFCPRCQPIFSALYHELGEYCRMHAPRDPQTLANWEKSMYRVNHARAEERLAMEIEKQYFIAFNMRVQTTAPFSAVSKSPSGLVRCLRAVNKFVATTRTMKGAVGLSLQGPNWGGWLPELMCSLHLFLVEQACQGRFAEFAGFVNRQQGPNDNNNNNNGMDIDMNMDMDIDLTEVLWLSFYDLGGWCYPIRGTRHDKISIVCEILLQNGIEDFREKKRSPKESAERPKLPTIRALRPSSPSLESPSHTRKYPSNDRRLAHYYSI